MRYKDIINKLQAFSGDKRIVSRSELFDLFKSIYNNDNLKTFENLISYLKNNHVITNYSLDKFLILNKRYYEYNPSDEIKKIDKILFDEYPDIKHTTWETNIVNEFTHHFAVNNIIVVETEKFTKPYFALKLKEFLKDYIVTTDDLFVKSRDFIFNDDKIVVVKSLHSKAPVNRIGINQFYITLEKIIIDFMKDDMFIQFQDKELEYILKNILDVYDINYLKLFNYAKVRGVSNELEELLGEMNLLQHIKEA